MRVYCPSGIESVGHKNECGCRLSVATRDRTAYGEKRGRRGAGVQAARSVQDVHDARKQVMLRTAVGQDAPQLPGASRHRDAFTRVGCPSEVQVSGRSRSKDGRSGVDDCGGCVDTCGLRSRHRWPRTEHRLKPPQTDDEAMFVSGTCWIHVLITTGMMMASLLIGHAITWP